MPKKNKQSSRVMTSRQCEIAAESYAACLLAQAGYDVLVQYGANQPDYDLIAVSSTARSLVSVKGSQGGGWMLAVKYKNSENSYHEAIDSWLENQIKHVVYLFVQFLDVPLGGAPRAYIAHPEEIARQLKLQRGHQGYGTLREDLSSSKPKSQWKDKLPVEWEVSLSRIREVIG